MKKRSDGRDTRWAEHRIERRRQLVESTLRAIRKHGATVGMDEVAAEAGTSKTVIYRHFGDRPGLYLAVVEQVAEFITKDLHDSVAWEARGDLSTLVTDLAHAYLGLVERDPEIYRFVMSRPLVGSDEDPVSGLTKRIGEQIADVLRNRGLADSRADVWGHALVGCVRAVTDQWIRTGMPRARASVAGDVAALVGPALIAEVLVPTA